MYFLYSIVYSLAFLALIPRFLFQRAKYASGFRQRLGTYLEFKQDDRKVIWLHCVSVGETNAARPLVDKLIEAFPGHRLIISTITKTGQELAQKIFASKADAIFYFPFDWKFTVRRALQNFKPSLVLLMETEIWPRFIHEAKQSGAKIAIINGRLSERSARRYSKVKSFISRVLSDVDLALMQTESDAKRMIELGFDEDRVAVTGNVKFDQVAGSADLELTEYFRIRFGLTGEIPLVIAASTHDPEENLVLDALVDMLGTSCRLMIAPRHPERFDAVEQLLKESPYSFVKRTTNESDADNSAHVILLDSIGELRSAYPLADIVFVGGSLIPHGGQSVLEPAAEGKAIVTGPYTHNFESVLDEFIWEDAIRHVPIAPDEDRMGFEMLRDEFASLLDDVDGRKELGQNALAVMKAQRGATEISVRLIRERLI